VAWYSKLMLFSSVFGWWIAVALVGLAVDRFHPANDTSCAALTGSSSSTSVKSEVAPVARNTAPVWNSSRLPPLWAPQTGLWKFQ